MQEFGLELLMVADAREKGKADDEALRRAIVGADPREYLSKMFPALVPSKVSADEVSTEQLMDTGGGEWEMAEQVDPREAEQMLARLMADTGGTLTVADLEG